MAAVVVPRQGETIEEQDIIDLCREHLAPFKVPKKVIIAGPFPNTAAGKILNRDMREEYKLRFS